MYAERWSPGLRTGDILGPIAFPSLGTEFGAVATVRSLSGMGGTSIEHILVPVEHRYLAVVSHDCEFHEGKRNKLLLARLQRVPGNLSGEELEELRESNDIQRMHEQERDVAGVDSFLLPSLAGCFDTEQIMVFTTITPLPMKMADDLRAQKKAELEHEARLLLRQKLAWFFLRTSEDIPDDQKSAAPEGGQDAGQG